MKITEKLWWGKKYDLENKKEKKKSPVLPPWMTIPAESFSLGMKLQILEILDMCSQVSTSNAD